MRIRFLFIAASIFCLACFIQLMNAAKARAKMPNDSTNFGDLNKSRSYRIIGCVSPMVFAFTKKGLKTPLYSNPRSFSDGIVTSAGIGLDLGWGYRQMNAIFRIGPFADRIGSTPKDKYLESDSLKLSDEYYIGHYSIEFSYSCYYDKEL